MEIVVEAQDVGVPERNKKKKKYYWESERKLKNIINNIIKIRQRKGSAGWG